MKIVSIFLLLFLLFACAGNENKKINKDFLNSIDLSDSEKLRRILDDSFLEDIGCEKEERVWLQELYKIRNYQPIFARDTAYTRLGKLCKQELSRTLWYGVPGKRVQENLTNLFPMEDEVWMMLQLGILLEDVKKGAYDFEQKKFKPRKPLDVISFNERINYLKEIPFNEMVFQTGPMDSSYQFLAKHTYQFCKTYGLDSTSFQLKTEKDDSVGAVQKVREVLVKKNFLSTDADSSTFRKVLLSYQEQNGLFPDGKLGRNTVRALNESNLDKVLRACLAMEKIRQQSARPNKFVRINLPEFMLYLVQNDTVLRSHKIVVGKTSTPTPELTSQIYKVVLYPTWSVPYSITSKEMLPDLRRDPNYLRRNNMKLYADGKEIDASSVNWNGVRGFPYRVVQQPGSGNSLGIVKFEFLNDHSVYVHDTPQKRFFNTDFRSYSHGCMRCENPVELAKELLLRDSIGRNEPYSVEKIDSLFSLKRNTHLSLKNPVPIFVEYQTVVATSEGLIFYADLYGRDREWVRQMKSVVAEKIKS